MNEKIAIIIVNYNSWQHTINCLDSVRKSVNSGLKIKIFLIDNNSSDKSSIKINSYLSEEKALTVDFIQSTENRGFSAGNNLGLKKALDEEFDFFMILNNDTLLEKDIFAASIRFFDIHDDCSVIVVHTRKSAEKRELYCTRTRPCLMNLLFLYHTPFWNKEWFPGYKKHYMLDKDFTKPFPVYAGSGACLVFKKEFFDATGLFDENTFLFAEEFIVGEKCIQAGLKTYFMPEPTLIHIGGQSTKTNSAFSFIEYCRSEKYLCEKYYRYGLFALSGLFFVRLSNYLYKCLFSNDYRQNIKRFFHVYFQ